jgi:hypothetical protein
MDLFCFAPLQSRSDLYFSLNVSKIDQIFKVLYLIFVLIRCFRKALLY